MQTRPDLIFSVTQLSRRNTRHDMSAVDRVLRYVAGTATLGQTYCTYGLSPNLYATVDAMQTRSRTQVYQYTTAVSQLHLYPCPRSSPLSQTPAQRPSSLAPMLGHRQSCGHAILEELGFRQKGATCMYQDNMSTIRLIGHKGKQVV